MRQSNMRNSRNLNITVILWSHLVKYLYAKRLFKLPALFSTLLSLLCMSNLVNSANVTKNKMDFYFCLHIIFFLVLLFISFLLFYCKFHIFKHFFPAILQQIESFILNLKEIYYKLNGIILFSCMAFSILIKLISFSLFK